MKAHATGAGPHPVCAVQRAKLRFSAAGNDRAAKALLASGESGKLTDGRARLDNRQ